MSTADEIDRLKTHKKVIDDSVCPELIDLLEKEYSRRLFEPGDTRKKILRTMNELREEIKTDAKDKARLEIELQAAMKRWATFPKIERDMLKEYRACHLAEVRARIEGEISEFTIGEGKSEEPAEEELQLCGVA